MYTAILLILLGAAFLLFTSGVNKKKKKNVIAGFIVGIFTIVFFWFMGFWGDVLWFQTLGFGQRFWTVFNLSIILAVIGALVGGLITYLLTLYTPKKRKVIINSIRILGLISGGIWGALNWDVILSFWNGVSTNLNDPVFGLNTGFYMFTLPFLDNLYGIIFFLSIICLIASVAAAYLGFNEQGVVFLFPEQNLLDSGRAYKSIYLNSGVFLFVLAFGKFIDRYHLLYSSRGVVSGPGWVDVNVVLPAYNIIVFLMIVLGIIVLIPSLRKNYIKFFGKLHIRVRNSEIAVLGGTAVIVLAIWFIGLTIIPAAFESLLVQPNEITYEKPYISNNIKFTRYAFGLNQIEEKQFPLTGSFSQQTVNSNPSIFKNIRLWDWRALDNVYQQFQEFRLYYQFSDVDVDRYHFDGNYREVMVSAREMNISNLPDQSKTFVNERFQYTHGYGITMATVNEFTSQDLPHLLIKNIPPVSEYPSLDVEQPQIYYGELTKTYVVANSRQKEFDYPSGQDNIYMRYKGKGGVRLSNLWRKFLYGWKLGGTQFFFSDYPTDSSRIMFYRQILDRVNKLAPFLNFDKDPYVVLANGQLYWIIDAYTTSDYFPYSESFSSLENIGYQQSNYEQNLETNISGNLGGINYIRNSVKVVVNAYDGSVNFYIMDKKDPIINVWSKIFPQLFKNKDQMPKDLLAHIRYPIDMLLVQGLIYEKYHMTDPTVFYNQEDLWVRATEKYYNKVQPVEPYYIMWQLPGSNKPQFSLILPFTPKNRQVMIGWIAGLCDGDNYGKLLAYQFPKDKTVLGPQQIETKIDQDSYLSGQLSLWDQRGSNVIRGNVLAIPVNNTLFYVEPIYLQAETAAYPELRLVVVMHGDNMSYAKSFDDALTGLFSQTGNQKVQQPLTQIVSTQQAPQTETFSLKQQIQEANNAFNNYLKLSAQKHFSEAAKELEKLQNALQSLSNRSQNQKSK
jgi:uncharacterized membrane protein (UPF0182 family)